MPFVLIQETLAAIGGFYSAENAGSFEQKRLALTEKFKRIDREITGPYFSGDTFCMVDGVWGTIFRYFDVFDRIQNFGVMNRLDKVQQWRNTVSQRPSVVDAPPAGYADRLEQFLRKKESFLSSHMDEAG